MHSPRLTSHHQFPLPPDPGEVAMASVEWRRVGFLQRLVKAGPAMHPVGSVAVRADRMPPRPGD